ncbi:RNA polymerase subunit sigma [Paraclostridium sordellii]|uniref:RNA polymerase subunit sigma n=1 Tax=Paraclostridium sordellii TaxID=1505 RepID=UPI0022E27F8E|nr:RNA polymerase subunit sigma [Paeniclostridium sordellii]
MSNDKFKEAEGKLFKYNLTKAEMNCLKLDIEKIEMNYEYNGLVSIGFEERTGKTNSISKPTEKEVMQKDKVIREKYKVMKEKEIEIKKIENALTILNDEELDLVNRRYFSNKNVGWTYISKMMSMSESKCKQMRVEIIDKIKGLL